MANDIQKKERIRWVDAMRGFSMMVVVLGHVLGAMDLSGYDSVLGSILLTFRMPLFFFVSGYFSYRTIDWWSSGKITDIMSRKVKAQILCPIIFLSAYEWLFFGGVDWWNNGFGGYWFTIALFQMYVIYLLLSMLSKLSGRNIVVPTMICLSLAGIGILVKYHGDGYLWNFLSWENVTKYFQYFTCGIIAAKYRDGFFKFLSSDVVATVAAAGWAICMILWYSDGFQSGYPLLYSAVHDIFVRYCALTAVVIMFFSRSRFFSGDSRLSGIFQFIGQRTLDIYMIHFFLLPDLAFIKGWFCHGNPFMLLLIVSGLLTIAIVGVSLLVSQILRNSPTLENWLFGVRKRVVKTVS